MCLWELRNVLLKPYYMLLPSCIVQTKVVDEQKGHDVYLMELTQPLYEIHQVYVEIKDVINLIRKFDIELH
jgi:hypothetical protein